MSEHTHNFKDQACECGAKLVVQEPAPEMTNCFRGVRGYWGGETAASGYAPDSRARRLPVCTNKILKRTSDEAPYCRDCRDAMKLEETLAALVGMTILSINLGESCVSIEYHNGTSSESYDWAVFNAAIESSDTIEWRVP